MLVTYPKYIKLIEKRVKGTNMFQRVKELILKNYLYYFPENITSKFIQVI